MTKLNNQVYDVKTKLAGKYRESAIKPIRKEEIKKERGGDKQRLKNKMDQIKKEIPKERRNTTFKTNKGNG